MRCARRPISTPRSIRRTSARKAARSVESARQRLSDRSGEDFTVDAVARYVEVADPQIGAEAVKAGVAVGADRGHFPRVEIDEAQTGTLDLSTDHTDEGGTFVGEAGAVCLDVARRDNDGELVIAMNGGEVANEGIENGARPGRLAFDPQSNIRVEAISRIHRGLLVRLRCGRQRELGKSSDA